VKPDDFEGVIQACLLGEPLATSFGRLPVVRRSHKQVPFDAWAGGDERSTTWDQDFDKYVEFVSAAIDNFLPWLFRASAIMAEVSGGPALALDWNGWTQRLLNRTSPESNTEDLETDE
jgi:hypothetical protein